MNKKKKNVLNDYQLTLQAPPSWWLPFNVYSQQFGHEKKNIHFVLWLCGEINEVIQEVA